MNALKRRLTFRRKEQEGRAASNEASISTSVADETGTFHDETAVKVSVDIASDVRLAILNLTKTVEEIIQDLRDDRGLAYQEGRYALQLLGAQSRLGGNRKTAIFITSENRHLIHHGVALRMVHAPAVQVEYLLQHLPASTSKLERLAADPTGTRAICDNTLVIDALVSLTVECPPREAASAWRVLSSVATSQADTIPSAAISRALALLRCNPRLVCTPENTRLLDAVLSLLIATGSSCHMSAHPDSELPISVVTDLLHRSNNHHIQRKALILATEATRQEAADAFKQNQDPVNGPLYMALTSEPVRADVHALAKRECTKRTSPENTALKAVCNYQHLLLLPLAAPLATRNEDKGCSQLAAGCIAHLCLRNPEAYALACVQDNKMGHATAETVESVVKLLWRLLSEPETVCVPLLGSRGIRAFYELFERGFALMYRTRKEMRARVPEDQSQVERVVERQLRGAFQARPSDWIRLDSRLSAMPASAVTLLWHGEHLAERDRRLERHPAVTELRQKRSPAIMALVKQQRIAALKLPTSFRRPVASTDQRRWDRVQIKVVSGQKLDQESTLASALLELRPSPPWLQPTGQLPLSAVCALRSGKPPRSTGASRWSKANSAAAPLCLSLELKSPPAPKNCPRTLDLVATDQQTLQIWLDGLAFLLGGDDDKVEVDLEAVSEAVRADYFELLDMDIMLQLLETDGVPLPDEPPPVPPPPPDFEFALP